MPPSRTSLTLGVLGTGTVSEKAAIGLLNDLIEAHGGKARIIIPATEEHWSPGIETVADWAIAKKFPLEVVVDDTSTKAKSLKAYIQKAQKTHKATKVLIKVANLSAGGKLIVLWDDENDSIYDALEAAEAKGTPALDITQGLEAIEMSDEDAPEEDLPEEDVPEETEPAAAAPDEDLAEMSDEDIETLAEEFDINPEDFDTWDQVRDAIRVAQLEGDDEAEFAGGAEEDWPTADEVDTWDFDTLKEFAQENGIEVAARTRTAGYKKAIIEWLEAEDEAPEEDAGLGMADDLAESEDDEEVDLDLPADDEEPAFEDDDEPTVTNLDGEALQSIVEAALKPSLDNLVQMVGRLGISVDRLTAGVNESFTTLHTALDHVEKSLSKAPEPPRKAAVPAKAAPAPTKAVAAPRKAPVASRPATAPKADPPKTKGEQVMGPVLKYERAETISKAVAANILELWEQRPKGRPTERERNLYNLARKVIPEVKRPPGRPRKA